MSQTPFNSRWALALAASVAWAGCASTHAAEPPRRLFAVPGHALGPAERRFALASDWPYRTRSGGFTEPVHVEGVVLSAGRRRGPRAHSLDRRFRGRVELVLMAQQQRITIQFDAPEGPIPLQAGRWVRIDAHSMVEDGRTAYFLSVRDHEGTLLFAGYSGRHFDAALSIPGWAFALGPAVESHRVCGGEMAWRALRVTGPGGEAVLWPGYRSTAPLGVGGQDYEVDVLAARSSDAACAASGRDDVVAVFVRRAPR